MASFISLISEILSIELTLGGVTMNLGYILAASLILKIAYDRLVSKLTNNAMMDERAGSRGFKSWQEEHSYNNYMSENSSSYKRNGW